MNTYKTFFRKHFFLCNGGATKKLVCNVPKCINHAQKVSFMLFCLRQSAKSLLYVSETYFFT